MQKAIANLFRNRTTVVRQARRVRPAIESLGDRVMPTVGLAITSGVLRIVGDAANDVVRVVNAPGNHIQVFEGNTLRSDVTAGSVTRIDFDGGAGNDSFKNLTIIPSRAYGGAGNDLLVGGDSDDVLYGNSGDDSLYGGLGDDVLIDGLGQNTLDGGAGRNGIAGLDSRPLTNSRLTATGDLWAALDDLGDGTKVLTLSGPSGYGMQIVGNWTSDGQAGETFTTTGTPTLKTALGDLPLGGPITIVTARDGAANAGKVTSTSWSRFDLVNVRDPNAPFAKLANQTGIQLSLPVVAGWGVMLGKDLKAVVPGPWNDAVPYLFVNSAPLPALSVGSLKTGAVLNGTTSPQAAVVCDPSDLFVYVGAQNLPFGKVDSLEFGYSTRGLIPFTPVKAPEGAPDDFRGHLFFAGELDLAGSVPGGKGGGKPLAFTGEFNVNLDGGAGVGTRKASDVLSDPKNLKNLAVAANVQGNAVLKLDSLIPTAQVVLSLAGGTIIYDPRAEALHVRVGTLNPLRDVSLLKNTPLEPMMNINSDVDLTLGKSDFHLKVTSTSPLTKMTLVADKDHIEASGTVGIKLGSTTAQATVSGRLNYDGSFRFEGETEVINMFGINASWHVVWTRDGTELTNGLATAGRFLKEVYKDGVRLAEQQWNDGVKTLQRTWSSTGKHVLETWDKGGKYAVSIYQDGVIQTTDTFLNGAYAAQQVFTRGVLTLQRTWNATGENLVETWDSAGGYIKGRYDTFGRIVNQETYQSGVIQFRRSWNYDTGQHILEVYQNGRLTSKQLWDTAGHYLRDLGTEIADLWDKFVGLL